MARFLLRRSAAEGCSSVSAALTDATARIGVTFLLKAALIYRYLMSQHYADALGSVRVDATRDILAFVDVSGGIVGESRHIWTVLSPVACGTSGPWRVRRYGRRASIFSGVECVTVSRYRGRQ